MLKKLRRWKDAIGDKIHRRIGEQRTVRVTNDDLANGERSSAVYCPVALAVRRLFSGVWSVIVGGDSITVTFPDRIETWRNRTRGPDGDRELSVYIRDIDAGRYVEPRDFVIERTYIGRYR